MGASAARRQRRLAAKKLGYFKQTKNETMKERSERTARSREMGEKLHLMHLQNVRNNQLEEERRRAEERRNRESEEKAQEDNIVLGSPFDFLDSGGSGPEASNQKPL